MLAAIARYFQLFEIIELKTLDRRWAMADFLKMSRPADIVLVTIDEQTEAELGNHLYWSPEDYLPFVATLQAAQPAAIALTIWLNREWPGDDNSLPGESLLVVRPYERPRRHWRSKSILQIDRWPPVISNLQKAEVKSFSNFPRDPTDSIRRTVQLVVQMRGHEDYHQSLELHAALKYWGDSSAAYQLRRSPWFGWQLCSDSSNVPPAIPLDEEGRMWIHYQSGRATFETISAIDLLVLSDEGSERALREKFSGKIVLIGTSSKSVGPALTPRGHLISALELRANAISTLLNEDFVIRWTATADLFYLLLCTIAAIATALFAYFRHKGTLWVITWHGWMLMVHLIWCVVAFILWGWWIGFTQPMLAITIGAGVSALYLGYLRVERLFGELRSTQQQLVRSEKEAAYGAMAAQVRHELRNILNSIRSPAEMVRNNFERGDPLQLIQHPEEIVSEMNVIIERVTKLTEMIENELSFFQNSQYRLGTADVAELIQDSMRMAQNVILASEAQVEVNIPSGLAEVEVDADKLKIVLLNLIRNACEAISKQGALHIGVQQDSTHCEIQVRDTGRGIPRKELDQVFEPFFTTKARGLGLGLANVRNIIEGHHGSIHVKSQPGEGTCFTLRLPLTQPRPR